MIIIISHTNSLPGMPKRLKFAILASFQHPIKNFST